MKLVTMLAKACHYAQEHIDDDDAWGTSKLIREYLLQCTSYQIACFLSQNTVYGDGGVEWGIIIKELSEHPMKSEKEWVKIINKIAKEFGGWKKSVK
jgi:hypothetical protein